MLPGWQLSGSLKTIASVGDLVTKARQHHLDELAKLAAGIKAGERGWQSQADPGDLSKFPIRVRIGS